MLISFYLSKMLKIEEIIRVFKNAERIIRKKFFESSFIDNNDIKDILLDFLFDLLNGKTKTIQSNDENLKLKELLNKIIWYCERDLYNLIDHRKKIVLLDNT